MPTRDEMHVTMGTGQLYFDGNPTGFTMNEIPEFTYPSSLEGNNTLTKINTTKEISFNVDIAERHLKRLTNIFVYGWKRKAPVRKKMLERAQKLIPYVLCYISEDTEEY